MSTEITVANFNATFVEQLNTNFAAIDAAIDAIDGYSIGVASLADLKALAVGAQTGVINSQYRTTAGDGGGGTWVWRSGDQSANVSADTRSGLWAAPDTASTGASGAWQRMYSGPANVLWWGPARDCVMLLAAGGFTVTSTSGSTTVSFGGTSFTSLDIGKTIIIPYIGAANAAVSTTITGVSSGTQITIGTTAGATVSARAASIIYGTDDTTALQAALSNSKNLLLPDGQYLTTATLQMQSAATFEGQNKERTLIVRAGAFSHTLRCGVPSTTAAAGVIIRNIHFWEPQAPVAGTITKLPFAASAGAAHIAMYGGQLFEVSDCLFDFMPYAIMLSGCTNGLISNITHTGMWDTVDSNMQEGLATVGMFTDATFGECKVVSITDSPAIGSGPYGISASINYTSTCGTTAKTVTRVTGPKYGVYAESAEGLNIQNNYLGGSSVHAIYLNSNGTNLEASIRGNFFDGAPHDNYAIRLGTRSSTYVYNYKTVIADNTGNGGAMSYGFLYADYNSSHISALDLEVTGNTVGGYIATPFRLEGVTGAKFSGNQVRWYNALNLCSTDPLFAAGVYIGSASSKISFMGDSFGGGNGYETSSGPNYCYWGIYAAAAGLYTAQDITDLGCLTAVLGGSGTTVQTTSTGQKYTGAVDWAQAANTASASTVDLKVISGNYVNITGTTTITALGTAQAGAVRTLRFLDALTLTHNASSLVLPFNGLNVTTVAGDIATFVSEGSGNWRCTQYVRPNVSAYAFPMTIAAGVNFNSGNTDTAITVPLPPAFTRYLVSSCRISGASASLTTATCGLFTAAAGAGTAIVASGTAITVSTASENTNNNAQSLTVANGGTQSYTQPTLYFRVQTPQGSAATANVTLTIAALP